MPKKKKKWNLLFCGFDPQGTETESEKIDKYLDLARELNIPEEYVDDRCTNCCWCAWNGPEFEIKLFESG